MTKGSIRRAAPLLRLARRSALLAFLLAAVLVLLRGSFLARASAGADDATLYLPLLANAPTPTPPPPPAFVGLLALPDVECPNEIVASPFNDYVYITNNFSSNVSVLRDTTLWANVTTGEWPTRISADPNSARVYVTNLHDKLHILSGTQNIGQVPHYFEGYAPLYNPVNQYLYITDLDSDIRVYNAATTIPTFIRDLGSADGVSGWIRTIDYDPATGRVFVASWDYPELYVIENDQIVAELNTRTWGTIDMVYDPERNYLYLAGSEVAARPGGFPGNNIVVFNGRPPYNVLAEIATAPLGSMQLDRDPLSGLVYATNPGDNTVTVINGTQVVGTFPSGGLRPWGLAVNAATGDAFVANRNSNNVAIFRNGALQNVFPTEGDDPFAVGANPRTGYVYVANRGLPNGIFDCGPASVAIFR